MKRKVHIILRFSKQVNPPAPAAPSESATKFTSASTKFASASAFTAMAKAVTGPSATTLAKSMARESSENEGAGARSDKRNRSVQNKYRERNNSAHPPESALPTPSPTLPIANSASQLIGKRKRHTPKSIGGGKGDLQPPPKKARRSSTSKQLRVPATSPTPHGTEKKDGDKRITRSQDTQQKSELVEWFEDRDDDDDFVDIDVRMTIVHRDTSPLHTLQPSKTRSNGLPNGKATGGVDVNGSEKAHHLETTAPKAPGAGSQNLIPSTNDILAQTIDLESEARSSYSRLVRFTADPLADDLYIKPHRGMGREEKRLRNVERDKAAYDKQRYEERLEKLRGTDWIKTFNLGGIAVKLGNGEMEKRRQVVIRWHESLLEKFKAWKEEERRQKAAKGGRLSRSMTNSQERDTAEFEDLHEKPARDEDDEDNEDEDEDEDEEEDDDEQVDEEEDIYAIMDDSDDPGDNSYRSKQYRYTSKSSKGAHRFPYTESPKKKQLDLKPFTSFYNKSHMRLAAISTGRKSSRNLTAFGEPLPEIEEREFLLPDEFFQQTARHMRARRRVSK